MSKTLCKWSRQEIANSFDELCQVVSSSAYVCRSCARSAADESLLCKPIALNPQQQLANSRYLDDEKGSQTENGGVMVFDPTGAKSKPTKKALKRQKKAHKKLAKLAKQQKKWVKKQKKLERSFHKLQKHFPVYMETENTPIH